MPSSPRVLLVARPSFADAVADELRRAGLTVADSDDADADVAVVELGVADWRAFQRPGTSVIVFADHADCGTVTALLEGGADDVLARGDRPHETVARIRAIVRRRPARVPSTVVRIGDVELDPATRNVTVGGDVASLTRKQFDLLEFLMRNAGRVVTREAILDQVWDMGATPDVNAVEVQVRRLRVAIGDDRRGGVRLRTVRGVGYLFEGDFRG